MCITLRPVRSEDEAFLCKLYTSTRAAEVEAWGWPADQQGAFLRQQFAVQHRSYATQFRDADHHIILGDGRPIGRLLVSRTTNEIRLVDIALLPDSRGRGIGTGLVRSLIEEGTRAARPVHLHVLRGSPARRLYERLGFTSGADDGVYLEMVAQTLPRSEGPD